jgi:hypothetical protein
MQSKLLLFVLSFLLIHCYGQADITKHPDFEKWMSVTPESKIVPSIMYFKDKKVLEGTMVYESTTKDPNFIYVDMQRFGYEEKGKIKKERFKFDKLDSLLVGTTMYRIREIKIPTGIITMTNKNALCRVIKDFKKTAILMYVPTEVPFGTNSADHVPLKLVENKVKNKFFQPDLGIQNFTKAFSKFLDDCPSLVKELKESKDNAPKKSLIQKAMTDTNAENEVIILDALAKYDECK